jgi:hypothetical protein
MWDDLLPFGYSECADARREPGVDVQSEDYIAPRVLFKSGSGFQFTIPVIF